MASSSTLAAQANASPSPARSRIRFPTGLGLVIAATLSGLLWMPALMAAHALIA
jgi:hypothetical protein